MLYINGLFANSRQTQYIVAVATPKGYDPAAGFPRRLQLARERRFESAAAFAREMGIENETCRCYERGDSEPDIATLAEIAMRLDVSLDHLILGDVPPPRMPIRAA